MNPKNFTFSDFVETTAIGKLKDVYQKLQHESPKPDIIIGVDTMVTYNGRMYGKPKSKEDAFKTVKEWAYLLNHEILIWEGFNTK